MAAFSYRIFKDQIQTPLERNEVRFLIRTFSFSCGFFFFFAFLVWAVGAILQSIFNGYGWVFSSFSIILGAFLSVPLHICSIRYRNNPLRISNTFVTITYALFVSSFLFLFLGFTTFLYILFGRDSSMGHGTMGKLLFFVFGTTIAIYLVPVALAFSITKKSTIMTLSKFLFVCSICYFVLWLASLIVFHVFLDTKTATIMEIILSILCTLMLFVSPIITLYRMKTVAPYINYDDHEERKRWENYFVFEISYQLLQLALLILRMAIVFILSASRSRLR